MNANEPPSMFAEQILDVARRYPGIGRHILVAMVADDQHPSEAEYRCLRFLISRQLITRNEQTDSYSANGGA